MVFVYHAFKANLFWMGVDLFFVLSGFLITGILLHEKTKSFAEYIGGFYGRRVRRIIPAYVAILLVSAALFGVGWLRYWYLYLGGMNFLVPLGLDHLPVHPFWSLAVEEQFYLLWPVAVYFLSRKQLSVFALTLLVSAPILRYVCTPLFENGYAIYMLLPFRMDTLAAGALVAIHWPEIQQRLNSSRSTRSRAIKLVWVALAVAVIVALVLNGKGVAPASASPFGSFALLEATLVIAASMFLLALTGIDKNVLSAKPMVFLGRISYSFYLFHMTALYLVPKNNGFLAFPLAVAYSAIMWHFVENPILQRGRKSSAATIVATLQEPALFEEHIGIKEEAPAGISGRGSLF